MPFKAFYNDWLDCSGMIAETGEPMIVNLDAAFFNNLKFDEQSLKKYRMEAAERCAETLGSKPAICLSGGADSQATVQCWKEANLDFDVVIGVFKDRLNRHDSDHAKQFCRTYKIPYKELKIDIIQLLSRDNFSIGEKYKSYSPHFNVHYRMVEMLADLGYTGTCFGGVNPFMHNGKFGNNFQGAIFHFLKIQHLLPIPMQGSFLSFSPELAWAIGLLCKDVEHEPLNYARFQHGLDFLNKLRYEQKIKSFIRAGIEVIPQETKHTGFELVKEYYAKKTNDGWEFEKRFRHPIAKQFLKDKTQEYKFLIKQEVKEIIDSIYLNNLRSFDGSPA